jgi:hypothetical protein
MFEEVMLDRYILNQLDAYDLDLTEDDWDSDVPVEQLSPEALELL